MKYTDIIFFNGINRGVSPFLRNDGDFSEQSNFVSDKIGILKKSFDYELKNAQITASQPILGGIDFLENDNTHNHVVAINGATNAGIYIDVAGVWTTQSQSLTTGNKVRFAYSPTLDMLFATNYADATRSCSNALVWSTSTNVTNAPKARYIISFGRRIYLLNCNVGGTAYPTRAYRSSLVDTGSITWDTTYDWLVFDDSITGVGRNSEDLFIACENSTHILKLTDTWYQVSKIGCVSNEGITDYKNYTFYPARDGMYSFDGADTMKFSLQIQDYWDAIPEANLSEIQAKTLGHHLYVYVGDITVDGRVLSNVIFDYNILQNSWNRGSLGVELKHLHTFVTSSGKRLFFGDNNGKVYELFSSGSQDNNAYSTEIETDWIYGSGEREEDDYYELWGFGDKLSSLKAYTKVDDSQNWTAIGQLNGGTDFVKFKIRGYRIKFLLTEMSKDNLFSLYGISVGFMPRFTKKEDTEQ